MAMSGRVNLPGRGVSHRPSTYQAHPRALVAFGAASAEIAGQLGRRASVGKAAADERRHGRRCPEPSLTTTELKQKPP